MTRFIALLLVALQLAFAPSMASAQHYSAQSYPTTRTISVERWVEEWDPASQRWVRVSEVETTTGQPAPASTAQRFETQPVSYVTPQLQSQPGQAFQPTAAQYGPFRVLDGKRAAMIGTTDKMSPLHFDAMLRDYPQLEVLELVDAPGTMHDIANLEVGRRIRAAGLRTHVPNGGSVRSGAVELFLAGTQRSMADGAEFAVHSWLDEHGRQPDDFSADHPANRLYLDYYTEMGMSEERARKFYAMTNSVPHTQALWLDADQMRPWTKPEFKPVPARRKLANPRYLGPIAVVHTAPVDLIEISAVIPDMIALEDQPSIKYADLSETTLARSDVVLLDSGVSLP